LYSRIFAIVNDVSAIADQKLLGRPSRLQRLFVALNPVRCPQPAPLNLPGTRQWQDLRQRLASGEAVVLCERQTITAEVWVIPAPGSR